MIVLTFSRATNCSFFLRRSRRCGTRSSISAFCVPQIAHFSAEVEKEWHTIINFDDLCATNCSFFSPQGAQDSACLAHKSRICHFVCQSYPLPGRETAPGWHTNPDFTALCAKVSRRPAERQRRAGTQISILPLCVPMLSADRRRDRAGLAHKTRIFRFVCQS